MKFEFSILGIILSIIMLSVMILGGDVISLILK